LHLNRHEDELDDFTWRLDEAYQNSMIVAAERTEAVIMHTESKLSGLSVKREHIRTITTHHSLGGVILSPGY